MNLGVQYLGNSWNTTKTRKRIAINSDLCASAPSSIPNLEVLLILWVGAVSLGVYCWKLSQNSYGHSHFCIKYTHMKDSIKRSILMAFDDRRHFLRHKNTDGKSYLYKQGFPPFLPSQEFLGNPGNITVILGILGNASKF